MSTFRGVTSEFPRLRFDYFRHDTSNPPPLACFLSHVHSDHLQGLENLKSPFVYCSPATKEILLRLEKYPHRLNFARNILETRIQTYRHLKSILKSIPLNTPTTIELCPGNNIRVTLLNANHCIGAVMFLVENQSNAILYTGDIRAEAWWVNSIAREPSMVKYSSGIRTLDCIYLDTTFATRSSLYRAFPSKADGLAELLRKVERYPKETVFHFSAWTFGYEDVWRALSAFLDARMHLDRYRWTLYNSLSRVKAPETLPEEACGLLGFLCGNHKQPGVLTPDPDTRLHSCEWYSRCPAVRNENEIVKIIPIVSRTEAGVEIREEGAGGGKGDLDPSHELELDPMVLSRVLQACAGRGVDHEVMARIALLLSSNIGERLKVDPEAMAEASENPEIDPDEMPLQSLVNVLIKLASKETAEQVESGVKPSVASDAALMLAKVTGTLPKQITFPYSRHSSYGELHHFISTFKPRDIYPCVIDEEHWRPELSMELLFGECLGEVKGIWRHDEMMYARFYERENLAQSASMDGSQRNRETQTTDQDADSDVDSDIPEHNAAAEQLHREARTSSERRGLSHQISSSELVHDMDIESDGLPAIRVAGLDDHSSQSSSFEPPRKKKKLEERTLDLREAGPPSSSSSSSALPSVQSVTETPRQGRTKRNRSIHRWAEIMANGREGFDWSDFGGLESVKRGLKTSGESESQELGML